ncbi:hypothetical protein SDC9_51755 [bioreactor metagenome]|uniref:Uncharacterized protein n=1 Tax=bioreactor metagenome TaxID=1076179 RepID=A0A644WNI1_9ZZZZ
MVNLNRLLNAPSGQIYLHQNNLKKKLPKNSITKAATDIHNVISP